VVALARGSVPEVVAHGRTGLVVDDVADLPAALRSVNDLDPAECRLHVEERFDLAVMATGYERVYRRLLTQAAPRRPVPTVPTGADLVAEPATRPAEGVSVA
jgi:hypothetical protein